MASKTKNEKKKKVELKETDVKSEEQQMKSEEDESGGNGSASSTDSEDLVNAINYNTITSLAALKDIIQGDNDNTPETDTFFQHYFMNHCNNLSSRNTSPNSPFPFAERRRLSQCREEDEDDEKRETERKIPNSASGLESEAASPPFIDEVYENLTLNDNDENLLLTGANETAYNDTADASGNSPPKRTVMGARHKFLVTTAEPSPSPSPAVERILRTHHNAHTVHFGTRGVEEQRPSVRNIFTGQNLHRDKTYFDSSLIEIRSTIDEEQTAALKDEDIWVKRIEPKQVVSLKEENKIDGNTKSKIVAAKSATLDDKRVSERRRSGTWGSPTPRTEKDKAKIAHLRKEVEPRRSSDDRRNQRDARLDAAITRSTQSVGERKRRGSADDGQPHLMYQQTIHGTTGVSRRPALFNMFKLKPRVDAKKQPSIMKQVKAAVQSITKSNTSSRETPVKSETQKSEASSGPAEGNTRDGSAHPHPGSDTRYYHTVTASGNRRPSAMAKVMDIFRGRASAPGQAMSPVDGAHKRKSDEPEKQQKC